MSLIRSTSNPEGLYIWNDIDGYVHAIWGGVQPPLSSSHSKQIPEHVRIPRKVFFKAVRLWDKGGHQDKVSVGGFTIEERHVYLKTGKKVPERLLISIKDHFRRPAEFLVRISYRGYFVHLWRVTWQYVVSNALDEARRGFDR